MSTTYQSLRRPALGVVAVASGFVSFAGLAVADTARSAQPTALTTAQPQAGLILVGQQLSAEQRRPAPITIDDVQPRRPQPITIDDVTPRRPQPITIDDIKPRILAGNGPRNASALPPPRRPAASLPPARRPAKPTGDRGLPPPRKPSQRPRPITADDIKPKPPFCNSKFENCTGKHKPERKKVIARDKSIWGRPVKLSKKPIARDKSIWGRPLKLKKKPIARDKSIWGRPLKLKKRSKRLRKIDRSEFKTRNKRNGVLKNLKRGDKQLRQHGRKRRS